MSIKKVIVLLNLERDGAVDRAIMQLELIAGRLEGTRNQSERLKLFERHVTDRELKILNRVLEHQAQNPENVDRLLLVANQFLKVELEHMRVKNGESTRDSQLTVDESKLLNACFGSSSPLIIIPPRDDIPLHFASVYSTEGKLSLVQSIINGNWRNPDTAFSLDPFVSSRDGVVEPLSELVGNNDRIIRALSVKALVKYVTEFGQPEEVKQAELFLRNSASSSPYVDVRLLADHALSDF